jgi:TolB-like protein
VIYGFNQCTLDTEIYKLKRLGQPVSVEPLAFDLLVYLIEQRGRVVTREELLDNLWKGKVVTDSALGARLKDARKVVQDSGTKQAVIKTIHGRGYQFIADVKELETDDSAVIEEVLVMSEPLLLPDVPSIAVLPFTNMSNDPEQEFFSDGITEDIITALSKIKNLLVIARNSTSTYKGKSVDVSQVSREQGVRYVLEGSVRKVGNRIRVTAQLIEATTGHHTWAEHYDRELKDIFAVQDEITKNVTVALQVELTEGEQARVYAGGTNSVEAWECVVRGKDLLERHVKEDIFEAQRLLERAVQLDPKYATALTYLGWTHNENSRWGWGETPESSLDSAIESGRSALELEKDHADSYALLGFCYSLRGDHDQALAMTENATRLAPNHAYITAVSATMLRGAGRLQDAVWRIKKAMRLSPIYPMWYLMILGSTYHLLGDQDAAVAALREAVQREPESILHKPWFLSTLMQLHEKDEAELVAAEILRIEPGFSRESWTKALGIKDQVVTTRLSENLRIAGLPE